MTRRLLPLLTFACLLGACAGTAPRAAVDGVTFVVVRHAEKAAGADRDPELNPAGLARASELARRLAREPLVAVYATGYRRTQQTVAPSAAAFGLAPKLYAADMSADAFAAQLRATHPWGTVLVAGHSNTTPDIVAALCACAAEPMPESEYDRISTIRIADDGRPALHVTRYGSPAHAP